MSRKLGGCKRNRHVQSTGFKPRATSLSKLHSCWHTMHKWNGSVHGSAGQVHPTLVLRRSSLQAFSAESSSSHLGLRSLVGVRSKRRGPQQRRGGVVAVGCFPCLHQETWTRSITRMQALAHCDVIRATHARLADDAYTGVSCSRGCKHAERQVHLQVQALFCGSALC